MRKLKIILRLTLLISIITLIIMYPMPLIAVALNIPFHSWYGVIYEGLCVLSLTSFVTHLSIRLYITFK